MIISDQTFLVSPALNNPDNLFQGYCFHRANYIFSDDGARQYMEATGDSIGAGEDGCYVSMVRKGDDYHFDTDFSGNKKVFYYWGKTFWAVSNSIALLVEHLKHQGITLAPNVAQLRAMTAKRSSALNQLYSYQTIVHGIMLVPIGSTLIISDSRVVLKACEAPIADNYTESLIEFLETWVSRFETLLSQPKLFINLDLTGGIDSRTVFSIVMMAARRLGGISGSLRINSGDTPGNEEDIRIARQICEKFGLEINGPRIINPAKHTAESSYQAWRYLCLGVYHPVYFPGSSPSRDFISIGGGGGENHRPFYKFDDPSEFAAAISKRLPQQHVREQIFTSLSETMDRLAHASDVDPIILHYRHFRNRFHTGRSSQYSVTFSPLASRLLEAASNCIGAEKLRSAQVSFDVIASTIPELLEMPFDSPKKSPSSLVRSQITRVKVSHQSRPGLVYGNNSFLTHRNPSKRTQLQLLRDDLDEAAKHPFVIDFWGTEFIEDVRNTLASALEKGRFDHAIDGQLVAAILAARLVSP